MDRRDRQTSTLRANAARKATAKREAAQNALKELQGSAEPVSFAAVARAAKVSRTYLYTNPELAEQIRTLIAQNNRPLRGPVIGALRHLRLPAHDDVEQHTVEALQAQVQQLQEQLSACQNTLEQLRSDHARCPETSEPRP